MNQEAFIKSGLLEAYLLGMANHEERQAVGDFVENNPEAYDYISSLEKKIQGYFRNTAMTPPQAPKEILALRLQQARNKKVPKGSQTRQRDISGTSKYLDIEVQDTQIKVHKFWRPAFITIFLLSKIFLILGLYYYFKTASLEKEIDKMKLQQVQPLSTNSP